MLKGKSVIKSLAFLALAGLLGGCQAGVYTEVHVESAQNANLVSQVSFEGEAAKALSSDRSLIHQVEDLMEKRTGGKVTSSISDTEVSFSAQLSYEKLSKSSSLIGLSSALLEGNEKTATLSFSLVEPKELKDAIVAANADQVDAQALDLTIFKTTFVGVKVFFPGSVGKYSGSDNLTTAVQGNIFTAYMSLEKAGDASVTVSGSLEKPFWAKYRSLLIAGGVVIFVGVAFMLLRLWRRRV